MNNSFWIWYPGDMELYFALRQNFSRVERGYGWPAFWKSEGFRNRVVFRRTYNLTHETHFKVCSKATGHVLVDETKYPFGTDIVCPAGEHRISIHAGRIDAFPSVFVAGEEICSDSGWMAEDYAAEPVPAGCSPYFNDPMQDTTEWPYCKRVYEPVSVTEVSADRPDGSIVNKNSVHIDDGNGVPEPGGSDSAADRDKACGWLYEFETELTAVLKIEGPVNPETRIYCGESEEEALDMVHCYYSWQPDPETGCCPCCAVRYAFIPGVKVNLRAIHQFVDIPVKASFRSSDERLNQIWKVAEHTFRLCSGVFFIDGVKRDKWIWSGDAYQSLFVNRYLFSDPEIEKRTLLALRGNDPITTHINTIVDYSMLWLLGVKQHMDVYKDMDFLRLIWPKCKSMMAFLEAQLDEEGFLVGREGDWIFIDWAELDKTAPFGAEQMLLYACYEAMEKLEKMLCGESVCGIGSCENENAEAGFANGTGFEKKGCEDTAASWAEKKRQLYDRIQARYWDEEKGAFVDSFISGQRHVSRQTNLFAMRFGLCREEQKEQIIRNVIQSDAVPAITTPYFAFFELDALGEAGMTDMLYQRMNAYWGGMLDRGAVTFWEEFDENVPREAQYDMYGDRFGKSLCHAWAASPLYLIGRYLLGLVDTEKGFEVSPCWQLLPEKLDVTLPVNGGRASVRIRRDGENCSIETDEAVGVVKDGRRL